MIIICEDTSRLKLTRKICWDSKQRQASWGDLHWPLGNSCTAQLVEHRLADRKLEGRGFDYCNIIGLFSSSLLDEMKGT